MEKNAAEIASFESISVSLRLRFSPPTERHLRDTGHVVVAGLVYPGAIMTSCFLRSAAGSLKDMVQQFDFDHSLGNPAVALTWSTEGVFMDPGETYDAGSGYFIDPEHVVTAGHVPRMVANEAERNGVTFSRGIPQHYMEVHDPRSDLHWFVYSVAELAYHDIASEFTILSVAPIFHDPDAVNRYAHWRTGFVQRPHHVSCLQVGQKLVLRGFTEISATLVEEGGPKHLEIIATTCLCEAVVKEILPDGFLQIKTPCVIVEGGKMPGNTSGGPVVDEANNIVGLVSSSGSHHNETVISDWAAIIGPPQRVGMTALQIGDIAVRFPVSG